MRKSLFLRYLALLVLMVGMSAGSAVHADTTYNPKVHRCWWGEPGSSPTSMASVGGMRKFSTSNRTDTITITFQNIRSIEFKITGYYYSYSNKRYYYYSYAGKPDTEVSTSAYKTNTDSESGESVSYSFSDSKQHYIQFLFENRNYGSSSDNSKCSVTITSITLADGQTITNSEGIDIRYLLSGDQATVESVPVNTKRLVIPPTVSFEGKTYHVNNITGSALRGHNQIESVYFPPSIQSIGEKAFADCPNLKKVIVEPNTVPAGFAGAFSNLANRMVYVGNHNYDDDAPALGGTLNIYEYLSSMFTVEGVTYVPDPTNRVADAIDCDYSTVNLNVPTNVNFMSATLPVRNIKKNTFRGNLAMKQIFVGGGIAAIEDGAFDNTGSLSSVSFERGISTLTIGKNLTSYNAPLFANSPITTVNKGREISYTVSPFKDNNSIHSVNANGSCRTIGSTEFSGCTSLTSLTTTDEMAEIGDNAFAGLNLTDVTLDGNKLSIGSGSFKNCLSLAGLILEPGVGNIGSQAFMGDVKIRSNLRIGQQNELTIGDEAFSGCSAITNINLGQGVTSIGARAFYNVRLVPTFNLSEKITSIGAGAFQKCESLISAVIPSKVGVINDDVFNGCTSLTSVTIPTSVTSIGASAFAGTTSLPGIILPENLNAIGDSAFCGSGLTRANIPAGVSILPAGCFAGTEMLETVELNKVSSIGSYSFKNSSIASLNIHPCVTIINDGAFNGCTNLATLNIENEQKMLTLGKNATDKGLFFDCKFTDVYIGRPLSHGSVTGEGYSPFYGNRTMQNLTLDGYYTSVAERMFANCTSLDKVTIGNGVLTFNQYSFAGSGVRSINIPSKVTYIPAHCFENTSRLESILIPETVGRIDTYSFNGSGLVTAEISGSVETITENSFANTKNLKTIVLNRGVKTIEQYAFSGSAMQEIEIPRTVTTIGNGAFSDCAGLRKFSIADGTDVLELGYNNAREGLFYDCPLEEVYIGRNTRYNTSSSYGYSPYYRNNSLKKVEIGDIPNEVLIYMFQDCASLEDVTIGDGVTRISDYAFSGCANLASFNLGASVKTIGDEAFSDCKLLTTFRSYANEPPVCGANALNDINIFSCTLYVPFGSTSFYQTANQWKGFFNMQEFDAGIKVSYIELSQSMATIKVGGTLQLSATAYPEQALLRTVEWKSSNEEVAIVDATGLVTALRDGIADITAVAADGSGSKAVCRLTVINEDTPGTYRFEIPAIEIVKGSTTLIPVSMINEGPVIGFQCDFLLPEGITPVRNEKGRLYAEGSNRITTHTFTVAETEGIIRVISFSLKNDIYPGNDGVLFYLPVTTSLEPCETSVTIRNIKLSKKGSIEEELTPVSANVTVLPSFMLGDVNGDNQITILDVSQTNSYVAGQSTPNFRLQAADVDGNGNITINDITSIISLILDQSGISTASMQQSRAILTNHTLHIGKLYKESGLLLSDITLDNAYRFCAAQMDIYVPDGLKVANVRMGDGNSDNHRIAFKVDKDNRLRVVVFDLENSDFSSDNIITVEFMEDGHIADDALLALDNCRFVESTDDGEYREVMLTAEPINPNADLSELENNVISPEMQISAEGREIVIVSSADAAVTVTDILGHSVTIPVSVGETRIPVSTSGLYIVNSTKLILK